MTEPRLHSLSTKLLLATLLSLLFAAAVYAAVFGLGTAFVDRFYMNTNASAARKADQYTRLYRYVTQYGISGRDPESLSTFLDRDERFSVAVYSREDLGLPEEASTGLQSLELKRSDISGKLYPMRFADGVYYISLSDNSRMREDMINRILGLVLAVFALVSILLWYTGGLTQRIIHLSQEASNVGAGDLDAPITVTGRDEISALGRDIDHMRAAIIERMGNEQRAWEANSELITAMSHDIRTPMTSLIGYLGLLTNTDSELSEKERSHYLEAAYGKSLALKSLTDELFKYFLVFGHSETEMNCEDYDAHLLLMQLLGEAEFDLNDSGLKIQNIDHLEDGVFVHVDAPMLKRVLDNLVSNLKKYADPDQPIIFLTEERERMVNVTVSNTVRSKDKQTESTKIGLRTCEKIMQSLNGNFRTVKDEQHFAAELSMPVQKIK
ncbi:MAG: HAMP domain-containing histidine kinase [Oscillospiraceae bacterium]|nr:HAMP domain-containing histidine kinase [Oscillospiraceae bacterium]